MANNNTLLSSIAQRFTNDLEDVATEALSFILSRSPAARSALSDLLGDDRGPLPIEKTQTWLADAYGAIPDLACFDQADHLVALIESKFWAPLTPNQPVTYWQGLPVDRPAVLLFLAPANRVDEGSLWAELEGKLREAGHELGPVHRDESLKGARAEADQRRLILTSWESLLSKMAERTKEYSDVQACFEIAELQGLAASAIAGDRPTRDENLKQLIADAVHSVEQSGWASTSGLTTGQGYNYYARYLRLAGAAAALRIDYAILKQRPDRPLWLWFYRDPNASVGLEAVGISFVRSEEREVEHRSGEILLPILLPTAADHQATLDAMVTQLERIAKLIDPEGPTYR